LKPFELGKANLDQRADRLFEPGLPRDRKRLLVTLPNFGRVDALLEPIVAGHEQFLNAFPRVLGAHTRSLTRASFV
jgi:hypothetical protein